MIKRKHISMNFSPQEIENLRIFTEKLNINELWTLSKHSKESMEQRLKTEHKIWEFFQFINNLKLKHYQIFEYYYEDNYIPKACYRMPYMDNKDIILVITDMKMIVTIFFNGKDELHEKIKINKYL